MFWKLAALSSSSPVEIVLDKENFTLEDLLDEEEIIQECKALNSRLINFLRDRAQVEQMLHYIVEEVVEDADSRQAYKFPFVSCEIFTCEIDVILKTLVEEEELMNLLFSFLESNRPHSPLLAGYFSKVVMCLILRKTIPLMNYVKCHQEVLDRLVDLIGITSIMEVLVRLVGADDQLYHNSLDVLQWLADSNLLDMIVGKLNVLSSPEVHANAAETLCAIARSSPSPMFLKLSSSSFVERILVHALEDPQSKSVLVHSLTVLISLLDPKQSIPSPAMFSFRSHHRYDSPMHINPDTVGAMLPKLGELLVLLNVSSDEKTLPTTYGELRPPLGKSRLKIVEFIYVLLKSGNELAEKVLVSSGTIRRVLDLFFEYPYNNALHHHVESIIFCCFESKNISVLDHLLLDCHLVEKILETENKPMLFDDLKKPTVPSQGRRAPRMGCFGHLTRISNKLIQLGNNDTHIRAHIQKNSQWNEWQSTVLLERNVVENVHRWSCGRPTAIHEQNRDSDEEDARDRDYDVAALANNLSQAFRYTMYDNNMEGHGSIDRDDEDVYFDDESAEVVISSLRLGDEQGSLFTNSNWFALQDAPKSTSTVGMMDDIDLNGTSNSGDTSSDDEAVVGEDEGSDATKSSANGPDIFSSIRPNKENNTPNDMFFFPFETQDNDDPFGDRPIPEWVAWGETSDFQANKSSNPFIDPIDIDDDLTDLAKSRTSPVCPTSTGDPISNRTSSSDSSMNSDFRDKQVSVPFLFEEDVEFVGVEIEGTEKAMEHALKEGIVGEAGPMKRNMIPKKPVKDVSDDADAGVGAGLKDFNDTNYWRLDQEVAVSE